MDIALAVEQLLPEADYRRCKTYQALVDTWVDPRREAPSLEELEQAWQTYLAEEQMKVGLASAREAMISLFRDLPDELRKKYYPLRAGLQIALDEGDIDVARESIEDLEPENAEEETFKANLLALFPA